MAPTPETQSSNLEAWQQEREKTLSVINSGSVSLIQQYIESWQDHKKTPHLTQEELSYIDETIALLQNKKQELEQRGNMIPSVPIQTQELSSDFLRTEMRQIQQSGQVIDATILESRISYIESKIKNGNISPEDRELYRSYIESILRAKNNWTQATKQSLGQILDKIDQVGAYTKKTTQASFQVKNPSSTPDNLQSEMNELQQEAGAQMMDILKDGSPASIQRALEFTVALSTLDVDASWLDASEKTLLKPYMPTLRGMSGAILIDALIRNGYEVTLNPAQNDNLSIATKNHNDARSADIALKLNTMLKQPGSQLEGILKGGMLYRSGNLQRYMESSKDSSGRIMDPSQINQDSYVNYLKGISNRNQFEDQIMENGKFFQGINFSEYAYGAQYIAPMVASAQKVMQDPKVQAVINESKAVITDQQNFTNTPTPANTGNPSANNSMAQSFGEGVGKVVNKVMKIVGLGAEGGISTLATAMGAAGPWGAMVILGGILFSMFSKKGLGFWNTLGAIGVVGLAANADKVKDAFSPISSATAATNSSLATGANPGSASEKAESQNLVGTNPSSVPTNTNALVSQALNVKPDEAEAFRKNFISPIENAKVATLNSLIQETDAEKQKNLIAQIKTEIGYDILPEDIKKQVDDLLSDRSKIEKIGQYLYSGYVINHPSVQKGLSEQHDKMNSMSLVDMEKFVLDANNTQQPSSQAPSQPNQAPPGTPPPESIQLANEAYGPFVVLARMVQYGYLPNINFYQWKDVVSKEGKIPRFAKFFVYGLTGGPLTSGAVSSKGHLQGNAWLDSWVNGLLGMEKDQITTLKEQLKNSGNTTILSELDSRIKKLDEVVTSMKDKTLTPEHRRVKLQEYIDVAHTKIGGVELRGKTPEGLKKTDKSNKNPSILQEEAKNIEEVKKIASEIDKKKRAIEDALQKAEQNPTPENVKKATSLSGEYNAKIQDLETKGVKNLKQLDPMKVHELSKTVPWVNKLALENSWIDKTGKWITKTAPSHWMGKTIIGVGIMGLIWTEKGKLMDMWRKGDVVGLGKLGWDISAGMFPIVGSVHEAAILSNTFGYQDFILGKDYKMGWTEAVFRTAGVIPLGGAATKLAGRGLEKAGARVVGRSFIEGTELLLKTSRVIGTAATYAVLGISTVRIGYNIITD